MLLPTRKDVKPKRRAICCISLLMFGCLSALTAPRAFGINDRREPLKCPRSQFRKCLPVSDDVEVDSWLYPKEV